MIFYKFIENYFSEPKPNYLKRESSKCNADQSVVWIVFYSHSAQPKTRLNHFLVDLSKSAFKVPRKQFLLRQSSIRLQTSYYYY